MDLPVVHGRALFFIDAPNRNGCWYRWHSPGTGTSSYWTLPPEPAVESLDDGFARGLLPSDLLISPSTITTPKSIFSIRPSLRRLQIASGNCCSP